MFKAPISLRLALAMTVLSSASLLMGCASTSPLMDAKFGDAVRQARSAQTLNPNASANRTPVVGIDAKSGAAALERYQDSFRAPPKTFEVINIGGGFSAQ